MPLLKENPDILRHTIGGNLGTVNSWKTVDINKLTNGTYPSYEFLLEDNNYVCLALQQAVFHAPLHLNKMYVNGSKAYKLITDAAPLFDYLSCPPVKVIDASLFNEFPGWNRSFT
jgi:hypothetical protein